MDDMKNNETIETPCSIKYEKQKEFTKMSQFGS